MTCLVGCVGLEPLPYDPNDRAIDTGEEPPDLRCAPTGSIADAFGCECSDGCASGVCNSEADSLASFGYGVAQGQCIRPCETDAGCGDGYVCLRPGAGVGVCQLLCDTPATCPLANTCGRPFGETSQRICIPLCQSDIDCRGGTCDRYTGSCGGMSSPGLGALGVDCTDPLQCRGESCLVAGICSAPCSVLRQGCPDDGVCIHNRDEDDRGTCLTRCNVDGDCPQIPGRCVYWPEADARGCI